MVVSAARNYKEFGNPGPLPIEFFLKSPEAILDPGGTVELPPVSAKVFHHEAELGLIIGRTAQRVPASGALEYVFGFLVLAQCVEHRPQQMACLDAGAGVPCRARKTARQGKVERERGLMRRHYQELRVLGVAAFEPPHCDA